MFTYYILESLSIICSNFSSTELMRSHLSVVEIVVVVTDVGGIDEFNQETILTVYIYVCVKHDHCV